MKTLLSAMVLLVGFTFAFAQDEQAPIREQAIKYKDWTYSTVQDGSEINLRSFAEGKKLVLVVYFAPWCHNWAHEAPFVQKLYEKYKADGLDVIGVGEYDAVEAIRADLKAKKITFPVVYESDTKDAREKTLHYDYRKDAGDTRKWGSPWNIFLIPGDLKRKGDVLTKKASVVSGELIEAEAEKFVREKLGLPADDSRIADSANGVVDPCTEDAKQVLQKP